MRMKIKGIVAQVSLKSDFIIFCIVVKSGPAQVLLLCSLVFGITAAVSNNVLNFTLCFLIVHSNVRATPQCWNFPLFFNHPT